ncbi:FG-GAP-like repeat-containing protein [Stieleria sp. ICT_E10.1]|uniref:FG-GAP-like repeat-containing protein n=1 Tax=Stieleria sedimenti TaxID=2976331 RepID=UPI00217F3821|nr:FG-GAP-like repeat-containing protein [Stieleria sedimenti]MCS7467611.1 FG-GAP-like repeat-containing protein [Stieleria sedimenti]
MIQDLFSTRGAPSDANPSRSLCDRLRKGVMVGVLCGVLAGGCDRSQSNDTPASGGASSGVAGESQDPRALMESAMQAGDWQRADRYAKSALIADPNDPDLVSLVAKVNAYCGRKRDAANLLVEAARLANYRPPARVNLAVQALVEVGEIYPAIDLLEQSVAMHPEANPQRRMLVGFLAEVQRTDRIGPHLKALIQNRAFDLSLLLATTERSSRRLSENTASRLLQRNPTDRRVRLSDAFLFLYRHDATRAIEVLEDILQHHPDFAPAHAMYGQALVLAGRWEQLPQWIETAPRRSPDFAGYWLTLGDLAMNNGETAAAVRAYWEATRRDSSNSLAWDQLRFAIQRLRAGESEFRNSISKEQLAIVSDHADALLTLRERFNEFTGGGSISQTGAAQVARSLLDAGRVWEAEAWSAVATTLSEDPSDQLEALRNEIVRQLGQSQEWVSTQNASGRLDLAFLPPPQLGSASAVELRSSVIATIPSHDHLVMSEQSGRWGLDAVGQGNNPTNARLAALIRSTGVGGGAIDYDLDGHPDLMMMNAGGTMLQNDSIANDLMRNLGERFVRVSPMAGVADRGFGQGVAIGDFNGDGFPDLFFANLGANRLLHNNGDGSFTDCTQRLRDDQPPAWSTSAAMVDINGDSISDLLVTNYCKTVENLDEACPNEEGVLGPCHPLKFPAEYDQFFVATGTGEFEDVTDTWIDRSSPGRGLGIVAGALDGQNLGIFVANDMSRNAFYTRAAGEPMKLDETASARGVAVDAVTRAQASMGIASSDFDLDGDLDFYVTGFAREYNVFYEQISPGMWKDETGKLGLVEPTLSQVGFGTQAIDMDNDGIDEIIVTNGHIGEFSGPDVPPYELPMQLFRRGATGRFEWVEDDAWGEYFRTPHVGRALWTTDVNRDGRNDVMVTHTHEQVRLLINETESQNHRIAFRLVGTDSNRDAVGAVIRFRCNGRSRTVWSLAGDGYFCSNEKTLIAGLAEANRVTDLSVTWPDGSVDRIGTLPADQVYLITQGLGEAFSLYEYGGP